MIKFETSRLVIRTLSSDDAEKLAAVVTDEKTMQYTASGIIPQSQIPAYIQKCKQDNEQTGFGYWAIECKDSGQLVGLCGLNRHEIYGTEYLHLNYRLATAFLGKGFATETANGMKAYCFEQLQQNVLFAIIEPSNLDSINVAERCGFELQLVTRFKDLEVNIYRASLSD